MNEEPDETDLTFSARRHHIGQEAQMEELHSAFRDATGRTVNVHGAPGSGKSMLINEYADRYAGEEGGPILHVSSLATPEFILREVPPDGSPLIVLDELDLVPISDLRELIGAVRSERPRANLLTASRLPVTVGDPDLTVHIEMPPLSELQVVELLRGHPSLSEEQLTRMAALMGGNPLSLNLVSRRLASGMPAERILEWLESQALPFARGADGQILLSGSRELDQLNLKVTEVGEELIGSLAARPELMYELEPRRFEELVAELFRRRGYEAHLTPMSGDEGVDIWVISNEGLGQTLWAVQAKRYAPHNRIKPAVVRELLGTVVAKNATAGLVVTTSTFQPGAIREAERHQYRLGLRDYFDLQEMLRWKPPSP